MTKIEIINETIDYYTSHPRGVIDNPTMIACVYKSSAGNMCAIGRCMPEAIIEKYATFSGSICSLWDSIYPHDCCKDETNIDELLQEKYHGHSMKFWQNIQSLHDIRENWYNQTLTAYGKASVEKLFSVYANQ